MPAHLVKHLIGIAACVALVNQAHANDGVIVQVIGEGSYQPGEHAYQTTTFSDGFLSALAASNIQLSAIGPSALSGGNNLSAPIASMTMQPSAPGNSVGAIVTSASQGGFQLTDAAGTLSITGLIIDRSQQTIYGDVLGLPGSSAPTHMALWTYASESGLGYMLDLPMMTSDYCAGTNNSCEAYTIQGLALAAQAGTAIGLGLGLSPASLNALNAVANQGQIQVFIGKPMPAVPEPSTSALMWLGLLACVGCARAARQDD